MWRVIGELVYKLRIVLVVLLMLVAAFMAYKAKDVKLGYEFTRAIPTDNPKYKVYQEFRKKFGEDGNLLVIGLQSDSFFSTKIFNAYTVLQQQLKKVGGVEDVTSVSNAVNLKSDTLTGKLTSVKIFPDSNFTDKKIKVGREVFESLPFYKGILYNPATKVYICGVRINGDTLARKSREPMMEKILSIIDTFEKTSNTSTYVSGLPLIRTQVAVRIQQEMRYFLIGSILVAAIILLLFFRSISAMLLSLIVVIIGVVFSLATLVLYGYNITILTALIPPLMVVIGVPNCIYFLNKYHISFLEKQNKKEAIIAMISKMGVVTLFCNITAAIGFAVFALTKSALLKEFGLVAGINIMGLFLISLILIPFTLSIIKVPSPNQLKYLNNKYITNILLRMEHWVVNHPKFTTTGTILVLAFAAFGLTKLKSEGFIVDDLPKNDKIYTDLKFFEKHFKGVMPIEITIHLPKNKEGKGSKPWRLFVTKILEKVNTLEDSLYASENIGKPTSLVDGLLFAYRARTGNDTMTNLDNESWSYLKQGVITSGLSNNGTPAAAAGGTSMGTQLDPITGLPMPKPEPKLEPVAEPTKDTLNKNSGLAKLLKSFIDSGKKEIRISIPMADVGTLQLNSVLKEVEAKINRILLDSSELINLDSIVKNADNATLKSIFVDSLKMLSVDSLNSIVSKKDSVALKALVVDNAKLAYIDNGNNKADTTKFKVQITGTSVTFLEGSKYLIDGLKESILWAFILIAISMMFLFRSIRILLCSLIPNVIPLVITAGVMGWVGVPLKPSTVLVFSMALGIAIDITIRFLVNYKQELPNNNGNEVETVKQTINQTGLSIIYTSLVLIAGFVIFVFSNFGGTKALGWLTTLTLFVATLTNLLLLPVLLLIGKRKKNQSAN